MEQFKRAQVIMLPINNHSSLYLNNKNYLIQRPTLGVSVNNSYTNQNLHIVSDDEIKEKSLLNTDDYYYVKNHYNEWYIGKFNGESFDFINNQGNFNSNLFIAKKIIATTDTSLEIEILEGPPQFSCEAIRTEELPQPSQQFIEKYIESYNKGQIINDILVEYELVEDASQSIDRTDNVWILKVNPKDNTITIKKYQEKLYNKKDIRELLLNSWVDIDLHYGYGALDKLIDEIE